MPAIPARQRDAHKGSFGRVLVIGGSTGMIGAPALAANAALRSGAGLVTLAVPATIQPTVAGLAPCATSIPLRHTKTGLIDEDGSRLADVIAAADVVAFGPGIGAGPAPLDRRWHRLLAACSAKPVVIDADGLNLLSRLGHAKARVSNAQWVLTPHPGEIARLLGTSTAAVQADRPAAATQCWEQLDDGSVVVLKGAGTLVTDGQRLFTNRTGNPGMATGGSGDVLTGIIAALIGQGLSLFDAATLGVHVHGRAGDLAARQHGQISLIATDILEGLPAAFHSLQRKRG